MSKKARKPKLRGDAVEVTYDDKHWVMLARKRDHANRIMEILGRAGYAPIIHGSLARGDINEESDIDIVIPYKIPPYSVVHSIEQAGLEIAEKEIVQATPAYGIKSHIIIDTLTAISFPIVDLSDRERAFYRYGGELNLSQVRQNMRTAGVNRSLLLIQPTEAGHMESPIIGQEPHVSSILGVPLTIVEERVRVLNRRERVGRTGVFLKYGLRPDESFEEAIETMRLRGLGKFRRWRKLLS